MEWLLRLGHNGSTSQLIHYENLFRDLINLAILYFQERGELKKLENKWWYDRGQCDQGISVRNYVTPLYLSLNNCRMAQVQV